MSSEHDIDLGFLGLGQIGSVMAERLLVPGVRLHVFDPRPEAMTPLVNAGAIAARSPRAVADAATVVFASLPTRAVSERVALKRGGVLGGTSIRQYVEIWPGMFHIWPSYFQMLDEGRRALTVAGAALRGFLAQPS